MNANLKKSSRWLSARAVSRLPGIFALAVSLSFAQSQGPAPEVQVTTAGIPTTSDFGRDGVP